MANYIFNMVKLRKNIGGKDILKDIYLSFFHGAKIGVIGSNGAGKSTLLRIMAGVDKDFAGEAFPQKGTKIGYLPQEPQLDSTKNVVENIEEAVKDVKDLIRRFDSLNERLGEPLSDDEMNKILEQTALLQDEIDAKNGWDIDRTLEIAMDALRCPPADADVKTLSGGERRRVALCKLLLEKPDLLLLDEPTNHLDAESVQWLERYLKEFTGTLVTITHDRYFLDNVTEWVLELDKGEGIPWQGNYSSWLGQKTTRLSEEEKQESARQKTLKRELEWMSMSPKARQAKSKWRISAYNELLKEQNERNEGIREIVFPPAPRLGDSVVETVDITKAFADKVLFENLNFKLPPGGIVGVIGPNGAGKSTLFKMIAGLEKPEQGEIKIGDTVKISYVDQNRDFLDGDKTVFQELSGGKDLIQVGNREIPARSYISSFGFRGADQQKSVGKLSGGERNRLNLAKMVMNGGNLLLLDEPTNDLDVDTLRALEDSLVSFPGCAVVISHDRYFLDRIATHILAFEGDSKVVWFEGNYQDYMADKKRRLGDDAVNPKRIKFKKLIH
ncbi:energy-dependent translational throttle protein EttA [Fluviispira multicolorata]|uniref:Energy-dependent translational throttle protein EttA n=1 Tax=Fluviispira multicolorata TaxID=2654512 RepID=A0A833N7B3_9BACT|nr:energy-dependent translational throttle protein EttA [Fluviispira multicolorata]KAB8031990.1 energy-dependent translational throttle protein EttA [Fluviispira multicolorata]